jgi:hypothetical protein
MRKPACTAVLPEHLKINWFSWFLQSDSKPGPLVSLALDSLSPARTLLASFKALLRVLSPTSKFALGTLVLPVLPVTKLPSNAVSTTTANHPFSITSPSVAVEHLLDPLLN